MAFFCALESSNIVNKRHSVAVSVFIFKGAENFLSSIEL